MHILLFVSLAPGIFCFMHLPGARQTADYNALSQHLKQAHMCLYYSALGVCCAEAVQIGTVPMFSKEAFMVTIFSSSN